MTKPIETEDECLEALKEAEWLWNAEPGTLDGERLDELVKLIHQYGRKHYPMDDDAPEWTTEDFARAKRPGEVLPPEVLANFLKTGKPKNEDDDKGR